VGLTVGDNDADATGLVTSPSARKVCPDHALRVGGFSAARPLTYIRAVQVEKGFDVADHRIAASVAPGNLVVTAGGA